MRRTREKSTAASSANTIRSKMLHREAKPSSSATSSVRGSVCEDEESIGSTPVTRSAKNRFREPSNKSNPAPGSEPPAKKPNLQSKCTVETASPESPSVAKKYFLRGGASRDGAKDEQADDVDKDDLMTLLAMYKELPDGGFVCQLCDDKEGVNVLQDKPRVVRHVIRAHGFSHAHECLSCPSSFKRESYLTSHAESLHKSEKLERYIDCTRCSHRSKDETLLRLHVLRKHVAVYRYVCGCCGKCFRTFAAKNEHEKLAGYRKKSKAKFECDKCDVATKTKEDLEKHIKDVHSRCFYRMIYRSSKLQYKCLICTKIFVTKKSFHEHAPCTDSPVEGNEVDGFLCSECGKRLSSKDHLKKHARVHSGERPYPCPECGQTFALRNTMRIHALSHCGIKPYVCEICHFNYSQRSALMIHWKSKHKGLPPPPPVEIHQYFDASGQLLSMKCKTRLRNKTFNSKIRVRTTSELTVAPQAQALSARFTSPKLLIEPLTIMPKKTKPVASKRKNAVSAVKSKEVETTSDCSASPDKKFKVDDLLKEESKPKEKEILYYKKLKGGGFGCKVCLQKFSHRYKVKQHLKMKHKPREIFTCSDCGKTFKTKYQCNVHANQHRENSNDYLYCCDKCDYRARSKHYLKTHVIRKHTTEYKFECDHCGKRFKMKMDLKFHLGTHGTSQHMCDACGRMYTSRDSLQKHRRVVHLNEYKFQCDICHQKLLTEENFKSHMESHKMMHSCDECNLKFTKKYYVTRHKKRVHKVEKTKLCRVCSKAFVCMATLRVHYLTHVKVKPYLCNVCGFSFTQRSSMMLHWKRKHPDAEEPPPPVILTNFFDAIESEVDRIAEKNKSELNVSES